ncbi:hypothetical protein, partial [Brevibacillus parabrevis]|uniref:hypothetical protein n=1 Tax=Brevibacillus parabrevis TaxID=54914 RepID=UPI001C3FEB4A
KVPMTHSTKRRPSKLPAFNLSSPQQKYLPMTRSTKRHPNKLPAFNLSLPQQKVPTDNAISQASPQASFLSFRIFLKIPPGSTDNLKTYRSFFQAISPVSPVHMSN